MIQRSNLWGAGASALDGAHGDALGEVLLEHEEDRHDGDGRQGGAGHDQAKVGGDLALQPGDTGGDGQHFTPLQHDELQEVVVPGVDEGEDGQRAHAGLDHGENDGDEGAHLAGAVDAGGLQHLGGDGLGELLHQKDAEGPAHGGQDDGEQVVVQAQGAHLLQQGDDDDLLGQGHGAHQQAEQDRLPPKALFGQGVAGQRRGDAGQGHGGHGDDDGVEQPLDGGLFEQTHVVVQGGLQGEPLGRPGVDGDGVLQRAGQDPVQGEDEEYCQQGQHDDHKDLVAAGLAVQARFCLGHPDTSLLTVVGLGDLELDRGEDGDEDGQHHAHRVGVAKALVVVGHVEDVVHQGAGGAQRAAAGQQLDQRKALEAVDGGDDQDVQGGGHDLGPLDLPEDLQAGGAVDGGGLLQGLVHVAQGRHVQDDGLADGGGEQDHDDAPDGGAGVAQPVKAGGAKDLVQQAVVGVEHPFPHHGDGHRAGDHRQVEHAPE